MRQFGEQPWFVQMIGQGWGSSVRFGLETASTKASFSRTEASFLHNGYTYFLMKTGVVGALMYVAFLIQVAVRALSGTRWRTEDFASMQRRILLVVVIALAIGTVTTGGLGYPATFLGLAVLLGACCAQVQQPSFEPTPAGPSRGAHG
jgi:O-antigen ligase